MAPLGTGSTPTHGAASAFDIDTEPDVAIADLRLASVHACGHIFRWHVIARRNLTVADLLRTIVARSQATRTPLKAEWVVLVELMHARLYRIFEPDQRLSKLRRDDFLIVYEVPVLDPPCGGLAISLDQYQTVACHARFVKDPGTNFFKEDGASANKELVGVPLMFRVHPAVTQCRLYELVTAGMYGSAQVPSGSPLPDGREGVSPPFTLYFCEQTRHLSSGGRRLDPDSTDPAGLADSFGDRGAALISAEWASNAAPAPWVNQQVGGPLTDLPECFIEAIVGLDVADLVNQVRLLREDRRELKDEVDDLRRCLGRFSATAAPADPRAAKAKAAVEAWEAAGQNVRDAPGRSNLSSPLNRATSTSLAPLDETMSSQGLPTLPGGITSGDSSRAASPRSPQSPRASEGGSSSRPTSRAQRASIAGGTVAAPRKPPRVRAGKFVSNEGGSPSNRKDRFDSNGSDELKEEPPPQRFPDTVRMSLLLTR